VTEEPAVEEPVAPPDQIAGGSDSGVDLVEVEVVHDEDEADVVLDVDDDEDEPEAAEVEAAPAKVAKAAKTETAPRRKGGLFDRSHTRLVPNEQYAAYGLGAATAVVSIVAGIMQQGRDTNLLIAGLGVLSGVLLILAGRSKRRLPTAFAAIFANFFGANVFIQFACIILAGVVMFRTSNEAARKAGEERRRQREEQRAAGGAGRTRPTRGRGTATATKGPAANKRYTPPKPKPKKKAPPPAAKNAKDD
jgi:hypothetical protein